MSIKFTKELKELTKHVKLFDMRVQLLFDLLKIYNIKKN